MSTPDGQAGYSEDPNAGLATPFMDLLAAAILIAISLWFIVESLRLPVPGDAFTAPGLLPFLTAASLLVMALMLGGAALARRRAASAGAIADGLALPPDFWRTMGLGAILTVYVAALHFVPVELVFQVFGSRVIIGAFEVTSVVTLTAVLRLFWKEPLWACLGVTLAWITFLSLVFRMVFHVHLP